MQRRSGASVDAAPAVTLPWRLPNPPSTTRGRARASQRLADALIAGPLVRVWGPAGAGRTGLVLDVLHRRFGEQTPRTLYVSLARAADARAGSGAIFRALQHGAGRGELDWAPLVRDPLGAATVLIDVVDAAGLWMVLDDIEHPAATEWLLPLVATYSRNSRWIAIGQHPPPTDAAPGSAVQVTELTPAALRAIAADWGHADTAAVERAVHAAQGLPGRLDSALHGDRAAALTALLAGDPRERRLLAALAAVPEGLALPLLEDLDALPEDGRCRALAEQGWLIRRGDVLQLDHRRRDAVAIGRSPTLDARLLAALEAAPGAAQWMRALELAADLHDRPALARVLDTRGEVLLADGYAPRVAELLAHETGRDLRRWRWQAECVMGLVERIEPDRLDPELPPRAVRYALNALGLSGRWSDSLALSARCLDRWAAAPPPGEWLDHVRVARGWALVQVGRYAEARALIDDVPPLDSPRMETMALALRAHLLAVAGEVDEALAIGRRMWRTLVTLPERARKRRMYVTAHLFYQLQRFEEAEAVIRAVVGDADWALLPVQCDRHVLVLLAAVYLHRARFVEAARCARRAETFLAGNAPVRASLVGIASRAAIQMGRTDGWMLRLQRMAAEMSATERADLRVGLRSAMLLLQLAAGPDAADALPPTAEPNADPRLESTRRALTALCALRRGEPVAADEPGHGPEAAAWWAIVAGTRQMLAGHPAAATLRAARTPLRARGMGSMLLSLQQAVCEATLLEGDRPTLAVEAGALAELAHESPRFQAEAQFFALCARPDGPEGEAPWRALIEAAGACAAARRARALLDERDPLDALDRRIASAVRARATLGAAVGWAEAAPGAPWSLSGRAGLVEGPAGRLDLTRSQILRRLLVALAEAGGARDKEALVHAVWQVAAYHPLEHDNRLRVAVRKLRGLLAERAGLTDVLLTTADGYGLRGPCRYRP